MFGILADHPHHTFAVDDLALIANFLYRCSYLHNPVLSSPFSVIADSCFLAITTETAYLYRYTILPRFRSYGDNSTATLSPGRMRMKFLRILPETCASTWCLFSSSTRNMALGSGSTTVAMTSIASSLLMHSLLFSSQFWSNSDSHLTTENCLPRQNQRPILCDRYTVLKMSAVAAVFRDRGPLVA